MRASAALHSMYSVDIVYTYIVLNDPFHSSCAPRRSSCTYLISIRSAREIAANAEETAAKHGVFHLTLVHHISTIGKASLINCQPDDRRASLMLSTLLACVSSQSDWNSGFG